jgi:hypothetical protein
VNRDSQYHPSHTAPAGYGFENGGKVPVTLPASWADAEPEERGSTLAALDLLRRALVIVIESGHGDGALTRAAALGYLAGLYASPTAAAKAVNVALSTMIRAIAKLKAELCATHPPLVGSNTPQTKAKLNERNESESILDDAGK